MTQPKSGGPKVGGVQIVGQNLNVINSIQGQPFLSTGGITHVVLGPVPLVDANGTTHDATDCDGDANTGGATALPGLAVHPDFTPGTNLQVNVTLAVDKVLIGTDYGTIDVVLAASRRWSRRAVPDLERSVLCA